jgi:hypothetical protein
MLLKFASAQDPDSSITLNSVTPVSFQHYDISFSSHFVNADSVRVFVQAPPFYPTSLCFTIGTHCDTTLFDVFIPDTCERYFRVQAILYQQMTWPTLTSNYLYANSCSFTTGIEEKEEQNVQIDSFQIFNMEGKLVLSGTREPQKNGLKPGVYGIRYISRGKSFAKSFGIM